MMTPKTIIAGNWKMHKTVEESIAFVTALDAEITGKPGSEHITNGKIEVLVYPPYTSLYSLKGKAKQITVGSQNIFFEEKGAFTGEISPLMLKDLVTYTLIGHSERRHVFGEIDTDLNKKVRTALKYGFIPMLCIGETLEQREAGKTFDICKEQLYKGLEGIETDEIARITVAYEPVWAIGTGKTATPEQAQEVHAFIRELLKERTDAYLEVPILYGGSVKASNSFEILAKKDINGVLVGGASLKVDEFFGIIETSYKLAVQ